MKSRFFIFIIITLLAIPASLFAGGHSAKCNTKYPIVLAHGFAAQAKVLGIIDYWWGIEGALEDEGADVYATSVNGMDSSANKALSFKQQFLQILAISGKSKANIIGHSHGTIYTRYAISNLGLAPSVASYTSLCGVHRGSSIADFVFKIVPQGSWSLVGSISDFIYTFVFGDKNPNSLQNGIELTRPYMQDIFNKNVPDVSGLYYQSYAGKINYLSNSLVLQIPWLICKAYEGDNDGLVAVSSAKWGNFRGVISGAWWSGGVDHINMVNHFFGITPGFDAPGFYINLVSDLKGRGF